MKRIISIIMVLALLLAFFPGCQQSGPKDKTGDKDTQEKGKTDTITKDSGSGIVTPAGQLPIVKDGNDVTITAFAALTSRVDNLENNAFTKWLTEKTNVKFKFITAPGSDAKTKLNLLLNSGEYPDVIFGQLSAPEMALYGSQGVLISLNDLISKKGYYIKKVFEEYPVAKDIVTSIDGKIYGLPEINDCYHCARSGRLWVYMPWVKKLNLKIPATVDEYVDFLKAVKNGDPNGNGKADEIPLAGSVLGAGKNTTSQFYQYFMNAFMIYGPDQLYLDDKKKVHITYIEDGYKEGLKYLNRLYKEGLMLKEIFTISGDDLVKLGENPDAPLIFTGPGWGPEAMTKKDGPSGRWYEFLTLPPLKGPSGVRRAYYAGSQNAVSPKFFITSKCKEPEVAFRVGEFLYDQEATMNSYSGPRGKAWDWSTGDAKGFNGEKALYKEIVTYGSQEMNTSWDQINPTFRSEKFRLASEAYGADEILKYLNSRDPSLAKEAGKHKSYNEMMKFHESKIHYQPYLLDEKNIVPKLLYQDQQYKELSDLKAVIDPFVDESSARFINGSLSIDTGWDQYIKELKRMGVDRMMQIMQEAYDKKYKK